MSTINGMTFRAPSCKSKRKTTNESIWSSKQHSNPANKKFANVFHISRNNFKIPDSRNITWNVILEKQNPEAPPHTDIWPDEIVSGISKGPQAVRNRRSAPGNKFALLGALAKLRKLTISLVMSVRPSVRKEQIVSQSTDFHEFWYLSAFLNYVEEIQVLL